MLFRSRWRKTLKHRQKSRPRRRRSLMIWPHRLKHKRMSSKPKNNQPEERSLINEIGKIELQPITREMETSYLNYAMSVIVSRALPDARDGLKPVHRRILYSMWQTGLRS